MTAILEIPEVRHRVSPLSVAEYHQLGEFNENGRRTELIRGIVIEKMFKSPLHRSIASRLFKLILPLVPKCHSVWKEEPLTFLDSEPEPDVSVVAGGDDDFTVAHPTTAELVVEVAISSAALDRANASLYAEAGVKEYWIVLGRESAVEVYRQPGPQGYAEHVVLAPPATLQCAALPGVRVDLGVLFS
ncbi:MAG: hypothetical protein QOE70_2028 [Chthoniobacter sp.]|jgi:Uma2 family endonuclease|nr:hypothetical protein [Chthoniobacter sp.]